MSVTIQLDAAVEAELKRQAAEQGSDFEAYAANLLEGAAASIRIEKWERSIKKLHSLTKDAPILSEEALTREGIYADHD